MKTLLDPAAIAIGAYGTLARTGILETSFCQKAFRSAYFAYKQMWEDPYRCLMQRYPDIFLGGHIVDVGAGIGYTATVFADALQEGFQVFAFEPEQKSFAQLLQCIVERGLEHKVVPVAAAAGERNGMAQLRLNKFHPSDHRIVTEDYRRLIGADATANPVEMVCLDSFLSDKVPTQPVSFVKIDVQGYEPLVCSGMKGTLARHELVCVAFDYCPQALEELGFDPPLLLDFFLKRGFRLFSIGKNGVLTGLSSSQLTKALAGRAYTNLLASRRDLTAHGKDKSAKDKLVKSTAG
ncbi:MAG: FkbM family methyltransferase [Candidatus Obscuribacterales bacterium]|nr:FkbM family methyltransferase [Candidatus Obscuribacterales bacterium]